jgi:dTDP-4-dehydrorhamnose reductase
LDLANQIIDSIQAEIPVGIYHATNQGQATWFEFAQEIFKWCGDLEALNRLKPTNSGSMQNIAKRPAYSVLSHEGWGALGTSGAAITPMQNWKTALQRDMPSIIAQVRAEG